MTVILTLLIISVLIIVHEGGHYLFAKLNGMKVEEFSIGFGPALYQFKRADGEILSLRVVPFGGYVKIKGQERKEHYEEDDFQKKPYPAKLSVVLAGPLFNFLFAVFLLFLVYWITGYPDTRITRVGRVLSGYIADSLGIQPGDSFVSLNGKKLQTWGSLWLYLREKDTNVLVVVKKNGKFDTLRFVLRETDTFGIEPYIPPVAMNVDINGAAYKGGMRNGDTIFQLDSLKVHLFQEIAEYVHKHAKDTITFWIKRNGKVLKLRIKPRVYLASPKDTIIRIGISAYTGTLRLPFHIALWSAFSRSIEYALFTFQFLLRLITGRASFKNLGGIIAVGRLVRSSESAGRTFMIKLSSLLHLSAILSINLCVLNLIPFPALDGFHAVIFTLEAILRREFKKEFVETLQLIGLVLLLIFMVFITIMDFINLWTG